MSLRHVRKFLGGNTLPPPEDDSDGDYEPLCAKQVQSKFAGLILSDESSEEEQVASSMEVDNDGGTPVAGCSKRPAKAISGGRKNNKKKRKKNSAPPATEADVDEIDRCLNEVNLLLGQPPPAPVSTENDQKVQTQRILNLQAKHLNVTYELHRLFGPDEEEEENRRRTQPLRLRLLKRVMVKPLRGTHLYDFKKYGLSMSILQKRGDYTYFTFDHDEDYQNMHKSYLQRYSIHRDRILLDNVEDICNRMHVEALLEISDLFFRMEEVTLANETIENVVAYLQFVAHPCFLLDKNQTRLQYKIIENKAFHVALLKYMYLLTNKACHRTALEIAKLMLSLDPSDPLAVLFVIDSLALRAREHEWLIEACEYFAEYRQAGTLFNIQYSHALALYHVSVKNKRDTEEADKKLQEAVLSYPQVVVRILEFATISQPKITGHPLFQPLSRFTTHNSLDDLILIYGKLTSGRWREPGVIDWFLSNVTKVCDLYDSSETVRVNAEHVTSMRQSLFRVTPIQVNRHFAVIRCMFRFLFDARLKTLYRPTCSWDPLMELGVNRYWYQSPIDIPRTRPAYTNTAIPLFSFFASLMPGQTYQPPQPPEDDSA